MKIRHSSCGLVLLQTCVNEANNCSFGKEIVSRCDYSHMGTAIRLLLSKYTIWNAMKEKRHEKQNVFICTLYSGFDTTAFHFLYCFQSTAKRLHYFCVLI